MSWVYCGKRKDLEIVRKSYGYFTYIRKGKYDMVNPNQNRHKKRYEVTYDQI
jgi:hypothetical protein